MNRPKNIFKGKSQNSFFSVSETMHKGTEALEPVSFYFQSSLTHLTSAAAPGEVELLAFVHRFLSWLCFSITTCWRLAPRTAGAHRALTTVHKHHKELLFSCSLTWIQWDKNEQSRRKAEKPSQAHFSSRHQQGDLSQTLLNYALLWELCP